MRAGLGALVGLSVAVLLVFSVQVDLQLGLYLIAPFGASAVLLFAAPSSPLAQPWSTVVGSSIAATVAVTICLLVPEPIFRVPLAVGGAITAMIAARAMHPPGGAVAMTVALSPDVVRELGYWFVLSPVALGTAVLVLVAIPYARMTGRRYPFRQFDDPNARGTVDHEPVERLGLTEEELTGILTRYRQSLNLGVEDLARLIAAAEIQAAGRRAGPLEARDIMSRDLVTVGPDATLTEVADLFRRHGFTSLPVVAADGNFLGVIFQIHLIRKARDEGFGHRERFSVAMTRLLDGARDKPVLASEVMAVNVPQTQPDAPISSLLAKMADGSCDAVPVLDGGQIVGIVTRTDLIAALARSSLDVPIAEDEAAAI
ncbi:HPP family protein [Paracoccus caeni]|uniref:HPP family protein n=1 Tax=Paracoccus caeni TaxID=657651 RepID=A0A934VZE0_9RHOB|nr:HPP family protein [Paracoccus caeni]